MKRVCALLIPLLLLVPACDLFGDNDDGELGPMAFLTANVSDISVDTASIEVFRDAAAWSSFYCQHKITDGPCDPQPFDFERSMLIGVFWGSGFSGCREPTESITHVERTRLAIEVTVVTPADLGACERIVAPRQFVLVDRSSQPVVVFGMESP